MECSLKTHEVRVFNWLEKIREFPGLNWIRLVETLLSTFDHLGIQYTVMFVVPSAKNKTVLILQHVSRTLLLFTWDNFELSNFTATFFYCAIFVFARPLPNDSSIGFQEVKNFHCQQSDLLGSEEEPRDTEVCNCLSQKTSWYRKIRKLQSSKASFWSHNHFKMSRTFFGLHSCKVLTQASYKVTSNRFSFLGRY